MSLITRTSVYKYSDISVVFVFDSNCIEEVYVSHCMYISECFIVVCWLL